MVRKDVSLLEGTKKKRLCHDKSLLVQGLSESYMSEHLFFEQKPDLIVNDEPCKLLGQFRISGEDSDARVKVNASHSLGRV